MRKDTVSIYALCEPDLWQEVRYIGASTRPKNRLHVHKSPHFLELEKHTAKTQWIKNLLSQGLLPVLRILETFPREPKETWREAERKWIAYYQEHGARLTNISPGGFAYSDSMRKTRSEALRRKWKEPAYRSIFLANLRAVADSIEKDEAWHVRMSEVARKREAGKKARIKAS